MSLKVINYFHYTNLDFSLNRCPKFRFPTFLVMEGWLYVGNKIKIIKHCHLLFNTFPFLSPFGSPDKVTSVSSNHLQVLNKEDTEQVVCQPGGV